MFCLAGPSNMTISKAAAIKIALVILCCVVGLLLYFIYYGYLCKVVTVPLACVTCTCRRKPSSMIFHKIKLHQRLEAPILGDSDGPAQTKALPVVANAPGKVSQQDQGVTPRATARVVSIGDNAHLQLALSNTGDGGIEETGELHKVFFVVIMMFLILIF